MEMMDLFIAGIGIILAGGLVSMVLPERLKSWAVALGTGCGAALIAWVSLNALFEESPITAAYVLSYPTGTVRLVIDKLAAFFSLVIAGISFLGTVYAIGYMKPYYGKKNGTTSHFFFLAALIASMLSVIALQNAVAFLIAWEIMSLSSFFLVAFENESEEVYQASINYLIAMHIGVLFLMVGFLAAAFQSGSFDFASFTTVFQEHRGLASLVFVLLFIGFGTKAGFVPFHTWLPKAHPAAPSHISGLMSGIMIKTGIYGILRTVLLIQTPAFEIAYFVLIISVISGILGVAYAIAQHNIKRLLAYHSVENIGIIGIGIGLGMLGTAYGNVPLALLGYSGGILHVLNHSIFKSLLFFATGGVYQKTHLLDIEKLGGIVKFMAFTATAFLVGSIAICGLPPFNGFVSEFFIYWGMLKGLTAGNTLLSIAMVFSFASLAFIGAMALLCFTKVFGVVFLGSPRSEYHEAPVEVSFSMKAAMAIQMGLIVLIGVLPQYALSGVALVAQQLMPEGGKALDTSPYLITLGGVSKGLAVFIGLFAAIFFLRALLLRKRSVYTYKTWDCGYQAGNVRMQYTASSYAAPFLRIFRPLFSWKIHFTKPQGLFPGEAGFESHAEDRFERGIINPVLSMIERSMNAFTWIQSGSTQQYILYGLVFLISITLWIMVV
ncbi:MAG: hydrogenase [Spirochaetes bacterium]|nr:MAG: hydrogenase [Spirochaetota bacterium]